MIRAQLLQPPAAKLPADLEAALKAALIAFREAGREAADGQEAIDVLKGPLVQMRDRFVSEGYLTQGGHVAAACRALDGEGLAKPGDFDEETLERERWAGIDAAAVALSEALHADVWRPLMDIEVRETIGDQVEARA